ncbi:magnesium transporter [Candidatus Marinamargulisbacteria bacterium SCGC AG-343-D04]|nr:magnesium transporter [Candidatus Marinamargulisbacteria bacterium SCGC AG-343-D04]
MNPLTKNLLQQLIKKGTAKNYLALFKHFHEADIAEQLGVLSSEERQLFFKKVNPEMSVDILEELDLDQQLDIISQFKTDIAAKFIEEMEPDDAADLLEELSETNETQAENIINALPEKEKSDIKTLLSYEEDSAGALMTSHYVSIPENLLISEALKDIKQQDIPESETSFYIFIVSKQKKLIGYTTLREIILSPKSNKVSSIRHEHNIYVDHHTDQEDVALLFQKYNMSVIPVVDEKKHILGVITVDDVVDVVVEEASEDIYKLSGTSTNDEKTLTSGSLFKPIIYRIPWLLITILGGLIASYIINNYSTKFTENLFPLALSLSFIPLLMGLGGNVGNQSSAIVVRGIATGSIKPQRALLMIGREIIIGLGIGLFISLFLFIINIKIYHYSIVFSSIVSGSLFINISVATLIGTSLPLLFSKLNIDPAIASAPFISTTLDVIGQLIYFAITLTIIHSFVA